MPKTRQDERRKEFLTNLQSVVNISHTQIGRSVTDKEVSTRTKGKYLVGGPPRSPRPLPPEIL